MSRLIYLHYLAFGINCVTSSTVSKDVASIVNTFIEDLTVDQISEKIEFHYRVLGLINNNGEWDHFYFKKHQNGIRLFPR